MPGLGRARRSTRRFTRPSPRLCARRGWTLAGEPLPTPHRAAERSPRRSFLCFTDPDPEDIMASGFKVVGSAQRRRSGAILQHGSLLLKQSDRTPELLGVCDLAGVSQDPRFWSGLVQEKI